MTPASAPLFGCVEAGGTKWVLGVARGHDDMVRTHRIATRTPDETLAEAFAFFAAASADLGAFSAFGIAAFGPARVDRAAADWGRILDTPKPGWSGTDLAGAFVDRFSCPVGFDTDVDAAVLAEGRWGACIDVDVASYVTVGTGIGGGVLVGGRPLHGARHPEMGHFHPPRHPLDRAFEGTCPFHGDCYEGLASGPAIIARWGASLSNLPPDHPGHGIIAFYLAHLALAQQAVLSVQRIVLGGGVMATPGLLDRVRREARRLACGYFGVGDEGAAIVAPGLGDHAGLLGALALAQEVYR